MIEQLIYSYVEKNFKLISKVSLDVLYILNSNGEVADVVCYLDLLCQKAGIDLGTAVVNKFNEKSDEIGSKVKIYYY